RRCFGFDAQAAVAANRGPPPKLSADDHDDPGRDRTHDGKFQSRGGTTGVMRNQGKTDAGYAKHARKRGGVSDVSGPVPDRQMRSDITVNRSDVRGVASGSADVNIASGCMGTEARWPAPLTRPAWMVPVPARSRREQQRTRVADNL